MADWDPSLYLQYSAERTRPAAELLARVPLADIISAVDLGCGPGNSTALLKQRWPSAQIPGVD
ncbi:trans-aconitate 2-methyltransferase, partial [Escherichia coli]|nr:trans-aconitate 2-methyltransferase [Escherichia coli]